MTQRNESRSQELDEDDIDLSYQIDSPFRSKNSRILLSKQSDETVEVILEQIPAPNNYHLNHVERVEVEGERRVKDEELASEHAVSKWIVEDTKNILAEFEPKTSTFKSNNPIYTLWDIYFECPVDEVDDAVMKSKEFLVTLEQKAVRHAEEYGNENVSWPSERL